MYKGNLEIETPKNNAEFITDFGRETINKSTTLVSISKEVLGIEATLRQDTYESDFRHCYGNFFESSIPEVTISQLC